MRPNKKIYFFIIIVTAILLSRFAYLPLLVFAKETQFSWQNYELAYKIPLSIYLPLISQTGTAVNCVASSTIGYNTCTDDTGNLSVDVPDTWTDVIGSSWTYDGTDIGLAISAAPNLSDFNNYYDAEGMFFGTSDQFAKYGGYVQWLDFYTASYRINCTFEGRFDYNDGLYRGKYDFYSNCGTDGYDAYILSAVDIVDPTSKITLIEVQVVPGDTATVEQILHTFYVYF